MKKNKIEGALPKLCVVAKEIRAAYGESQPRFAQRVGLAPQTISRFERGVQVPADAGVLLQLARAAQAKGLTKQAAELEQAAGTHRRIDDLAEAMGPGAGLYAMPILSLRQWRLMHIPLIAAMYFPEAVEAIEKAYEQYVPEAVGWVNQALAEYADQPVESGLGFHGQLSKILTNLAGQRAIEQYKPQRNK
jgi:transcriptional regulator with XRE-family HTH domain